MTLASDVARDADTRAGAKPTARPERLSVRDVLRTPVARRLATAWFLNHFALGGWAVTLGSFIKANAAGAGSGVFEDGFVGTAYSASPLGALAAPFLIGVLADRFVATEKLMCVLHFLGAGTLWIAASAPSQTSFFLALAVFYLFFHPTMSLLAAMSLRHLPEPTRQFPVVRSCGTIGWMAAGVVVGSAIPLITGQAIETTAWPMKIGAIVEALGASYCLLLPYTPPSRSLRNLSPSALAQPETGRLLHNKSFICVLIVAFLAAIPTQAYYCYLNVFMNWRGATHAATRMTLGQFVEVVCMILLPAMLLRLGLRTAVLAGIAAWGLRYGLLALAAAQGGHVWAVYLAIALHGVAFTFISISLQLEVEAVVDHRQRGAAQGLLAVATQGLGCLAGTRLAGLAEAYWLPGGLDSVTAVGWERFWLAPLAVVATALVAGILLLPSPSLHRRNP